jgi:hypothetical protein
VRGNYPPPHHGEKPSNRSSPSPRTPPPADAVALYRELEGLDPMRAGFYRDAADGRVAAVFFGGGGAAPAS